MAPLPVLADDLFSDAASADPYPLYRRLRDLGPVVWLKPQGIAAVGRYDDVRAVLGDHDTDAVVCQALSVVPDFIVPEECRESLSPTRGSPRW